MLVQAIHDGGYPMVSLSKNRIVKQYFVHYLVLLTFHKPRPRGMECCHKDGDPTNRNLSNLRWDTKSGNMQDAIRHGTASGGSLPGESNPSAKLTEAEVRQIRQMHATGLHSIGSLSRTFKVTKFTISWIVKYRTWRHII